MYPQGCGGSSPFFGTKSERKSARGGASNQSKSRGQNRGLHSHDGRTELFVFVVVDTAAGTVLLTIQLILFLLREMAVVRSHIFLLLVLDSGFPVFQVRSLTGRQLAAADAVRNPVLLVFFPLIDLIYPRMIGIDHSRTSACGRVSGLSGSGA